MPYLWNEICINYLRIKMDFILEKLIRQKLTKIATI